MKRPKMAGNKNAKKNNPRLKLNVRVSQSTLDKLQQWADKESDGNVGRWLDMLAGRYTND